MNIKFNAITKRRLWELDVYYYNFKVGCGSVFSNLFEPRPTLGQQLSIATPGVWKKDSVK
jgi:hypothetical protein